MTMNPLLVACEAAGQLDVALSLLREMRERNIQRDAYTYSTLIACCKVRVVWWWSCARVCYVGGVGWVGLGGEVE